MGVLLNTNACRARMGKLDAFHEDPDKCGKVSQEVLRKKTFCWGGFLADSSSQFELVFRNPIYTVLRLTGAAASQGRSRKVDFDSSSTWNHWLEGVQGQSAARALARAAGRWPKSYGGFDVAQVMQAKAEKLAPQDPIVLLQRGELDLA